jgi:hypothetical protein
MSKSQTGNVAEIPATLQTLWGWSPQIEWQGSMKVGKQHIVVYGPAFSIFGTSTPKTFFTSLKSKQVSSGFVNRHLLFNVGRGAEELADEERDMFSIPDWLAEALKEVAGEVAPLDNRPLKNGLHIVRDWRRIGWGEGARVKWRGYWGRLRKLPTEEKREIWARCAEMALRMATIVAVYRGSDLVEVEDLDWSIALAEHSTTQIEAGVDKHMLETLERADLIDHVRRVWSERKRMTLGQVMKACERKTDDRRKVLDVIQTLIDGGEIAELASEYGPGRPTSSWLWKG